MILALTHAQQSNDALASLVALLLFLFVFVFAVILPLAAMWQIFVKAGEPGWAAIVPFYNMVVFLKIIDRPIWWIALLIIPVVNFIAPLFLLYELARVFGKGIGFTIGLILLPPIFLPILAFGSARYLDSDSSGTSGSLASKTSSGADEEINIGSPLEIGGVVVTLLLIFVLIGVIGNQVGARNSRSATPSAPQQSAPVAAPPNDVPPNQPVHPATSTEEPVLQGSFVLGDRVNATLDDLFVAHDWHFRGVAGQSITIRCDPASGDSTDPVVELLAPNGSVLAEDDDGGGGTSALISNLVLPTDGIYTVRVTIWSRGGYTFLVQ